jgi:predicted RNase H-like HicB family nuclease
MALRFYRAIAYQAPGDGPADGWDVVFPELPGCVSQGDSVEEALRNAVEAIALHLEGMVSEGLDLPESSALSAPLPKWLPESDMADRVPALLQVEVPGKSTRINITMDMALVDRLDAAARRDGTSRSAYLAQAVREKLQRNRELA